MNQTILQPLYTCVYYGQVCRIRYSTESSYETPLYHYYFIVFLELTTHLQPFDSVDSVPFV